VIVGGQKKLGPDVALEEIEETDADRAFDPAACGCEDCAEEIRQQDARDAGAGREVIGSVSRAAADGGDRA